MKKKIFFYLLLLSLLLSTFFFVLTVKGSSGSYSVSSENIRELQKLSQQINQYLRAPEDRSELQVTDTHLQALLNVASDSLKPASFWGSITDSEVTINSAITLPAPFSNRILLFSCSFAEQAQTFSIRECTLGHLPVSGKLMMWLLRQSFALVLRSPDDELAFQLLLSGRVSQQAISFEKTHVLQHQPQLTHLVVSGMQFGAHSIQGPSQLLDLAPYFLTLSRLSAQYPEQNQLAFYLQHLLQVAANQTKHPFAAEASTAVWALTIAAADRRFLKLTHATIPAELIPELPKLKLGGRDDLTLHFLYSAAMRIAATPLIATQVGALKEISDAGAGGSGFSFIDMAANKAGIWLVENIASINQPQLFILDSDAFEAAFMPEWRDLPEGLSETQLQKQFGGPDGAGTQALLQQIEQRLAELTLFR